ncbi:MAG: hypothetical protein EU540_01180 [Promethearchaeota archaeon]|nr:MAG: hypothetical protein EU540_01180 [Candidatus Lokiarchaeota archaeon]
MEILEQEYQKVVEAFPNVGLINDLIYHIKLPLINDVFLEIKFKNYPKKPKVILVREDGQTDNSLDTMLSALKSWKKKAPLSIAELINEIHIFIKRMQTKEILIQRDLLNGMFALCRNQHPREILGLLRVDNGVVKEYILPPGALTSYQDGVFFPSRLPLDPSLEGTVHSHPSGNPYPSLGDLNNVFKLKKFHFILAFPYNGLDCVKCFDKNGHELKFKIIT